MSIAKFILIFFLFLILPFVAIFAGPTPPPGTSFVEYLSPPIIGTPIYDCSTAVVVKGYTVGAKIIIYANGNEVLAQGSPYYWWWPFHLNRDLKTGDVITAVQVIGKDCSYHTRKPITVQKLPSYVLENHLPAPVVGKPLYDCQKAVFISNVLEGCTTEVYKITSTLLGRSDTPFQNVSVGTPKLSVGEKIYARQSFCSKKYESPNSKTVTVQTRPKPMPDPTIDKNSLVEGAKWVNVYGLLIGAEVSIYDSNNNRVGGGIASSTANAIPVNPAVSINLKYTAEQALCDSKGTSKSEQPKDTLDAPKIVAPICEGSISVDIENTVVNATIKIYVNGIQKGQGSGNGDRVTLFLGDNIVLKAGDKVWATQEIGNIVSKSSATETVSGAMSAPDVAVKNGHIFYYAEAGENSIDGEVFLRGVLTKNNYGPIFEAIMCGAKKAEVKILGPNEKDFGSVTLVETSLGHFEGGWDWKYGSWTIPNDIPVGKYQAIFSVTTSSTTITKKIPFYVIFNPAEVTAPNRFMFNETGIWFGSPSAADRAITYDLHQDDKRIFDIAIKAANGETDQSSAVKKVLNAETSLFGYSLSWHCPSSGPCSTLHLLLNESDAQCADDANMLTALLRAVGIPSHPVTADAALENGQASWNFDTWTEARFKGSNGELWYSMHPHESYLPVRRATAGTSWGVATKSSNDLMIMANEKWIASEVTDYNNDVSYGYNTSCKEPDQNLTKASWIEHLCLAGSTGEGYWTEGHWECSPSPAPGIEIHLNKETFRVGDTILITIIISNEEKIPIKGNLNLSIGVDNVFTKLFPDNKIEIGDQIVSIEPGKSREFRKEYRLKTDFSTDLAYVLMAKFEDKSGVLPFKVLPLYDSDLKLPEKITVGDSFEVILEIHNTSKEEIKDISCFIGLPYGVIIKEDSIRQGIGSLKPDEKMRFVWKLFAETPNEAAGFILNIISSNGGRTILRQGLEIVMP